MRLLILCYFINTLIAAAMGFWL